MMKDGVGASISADCPTEYGGATHRHLLSDWQGHDGHLLECYGRSLRKQLLSFLTWHRIGEFLGQSDFVHDCI